MFAANVTNFVVTDYSSTMSKVYQTSLDNEITIEKPTACYKISGLVDGNRLELCIPICTQMKSLKSWLNRGEITYVVESNHTPRIDHFVSVKFDDIDGIFRAEFKADTGNIHNFISGHEEEVLSYPNGSYYYEAASLRELAQEISRGGCRYSYSSHTVIITNPEQMRKSIKNLTRRAYEITIVSITAIPNEQYQLVWLDKEGESYILTFPNTVTSIQQLFRLKMGSTPCVIGTSRGDEVKFIACNKQGSDVIATFRYPLTPSNFARGVVGKPNFSVVVSPETMGDLATKVILNKEAFYKAIDEI